MRRLTSAFTHVLPMMAAMGLMVTAPALAQTTPPPSPAIVMPVPATPPSGLVEPTLQRGAVAPTPLPARQGQQGGRQGQPGQVQQGQPGQQAQATTPPAAAPRAEAPRPPSIGGANNQPMPSGTNIRLDLVITDTYTGAPVKKTVSLLVLNGHSGMIRTNGSDGWSVLNVDAVAGAWTGGQVSLRMTFEYTPAQTKETSAGRAPRLNESITVVLQDGKPLMVSQSADPATDRKVTAELTATILK
jgi:hypothetical protein